jgi:hypothetical protein
MENRLNCYIESDRLFISLEGELCSGDLINFSYRVMQLVEGTEYFSSALVDIKGAKFNLIDGLWQKICLQFNERALSKGVKKIAYVLSTYFHMKCSECAMPAGVQLFNQDRDAAEIWLSGIVPVSHRN